MLTCYEETQNLAFNKYGAHVFHTISIQVWEYIHQYSDWIPFEHRVIGLVTDIYGEKKFVPVPPNQETVNSLFKTDIAKEEEMEKWLSSRKPDLKGKLPSNGEEISLSRVGMDLYEKVRIITFLSH